MKIANSVLNLLEGEAKSGCKAEVAAFSKLLQEYGVDDIDVSIEKDGTDYLVTLKDGEDSETLVFGVDEEDDAYCISSEDSDALGDFADCVDLQTANPTFAEDGGLDMTDLSWMNKNVLATLFSEAVDEKEVDEKMKTVIRAGKKVKVVVKIRKKRLSPKQKAAMAKLHRKPVTAASKKKRAKSLKIRKRMGL